MKEFAVQRYSKPKAKKLAQLEKLANTAEVVKSTFGIKRSEIARAIEDGNIDAAILTFQKQAYATILKLIPIAEKAYLKDKQDRQAYVLNALISQGRELAADLAASGDRAALVNTVATEILEPAFKGLLQDLLNEIIQTKALLAGKIKPQHESTATQILDDLVRAMAQHMSKTYTTTASSIGNTIIG